ncbi:MAG TPA: polyprenol monophosphomannose synthase [Phycisphaerae bacterium]|nr:polyprenol monophosphomannose synthase [Phycisphaerae bacterium]
MAKTLQSAIMLPEPVSIVVPTYKEAENIPPLVRRVFAAMGRAGIPAEMVIVDDDSGDGTEAAVQALAAEFPVRLITRQGERGLSSAVVRGFHEARHDILLCMDADLSHPPESLPEVISPIAENRAEFCIGSRYVAGGRTKENWSLLRKLNSLGATWLARPLTSTTDPMAGFFCLRREVLNRAERAGLSPIGYKIGLETLVKARCRTIAEVPIEFSDRLHGKSKLTFQQQLLYLRHLVRLYRFCWPTATRLTALLIGMIAIAILVLLLLQLSR